MSASSITQQPKQAQSAFWIWLSEHREEISMKLATKVARVICKAAGEQWKVLEAAAKAPYEKKAGEAKNFYYQSMAAFKNGGGVVQHQFAPTGWPAPRCR